MGFLKFNAFERLFKERGLPSAMRSDNGVPFASAHALFHLSELYDLGYIDLEQRILQPLDNPFNHGNGC